jgi:hypothetical protein
MTAQGLGLAAANALALSVWTLRKRSLFSRDPNALQQFIPTIDAGEIVAAFWQSS